jgi:hypothetical protein
MNERVRAILVVASLFFFYLLLSIMETIEYSNAANNNTNDDGNINNAVDCVGIDCFTQELNGTNGTLSGNISNETATSIGLKAKHKDIFEHLRWLMIIGEWTNKLPGNQKNF